MEVSKASVLYIYIDEKKTNYAMGGNAKKFFSIILKPKF